MSDLVVEQCDPRDRAQGILELFVQNGQPEFADIFRDIYMPRAEDGLRSWVGIVGGKVVSHVSVSPVKLTDGTHTAMCGVLGDLQIAEEHRDFWVPVGTMRTMVSEVRSEGRLDLLMTTTIKEAEGVFKAGGFKHFGELRRFVLPLIGPYMFYARLRGRCRARPVQERGFSPEEMPEAFSRAGPRGIWRPEADSTFYSTRVPRRDFADAVWLKIDKGVGSHRQSGWALVGRHPELPELGLGDAFWEESEEGICEIVASVAKWARARGFKRLTVSTLDETNVATELMGSGLFPRATRADVLLQKVGDFSPAPLDDWYITALPFGAW